jgi:hypothetical protein
MWAKYQIQNTISRGLRPIENIGKQEPQKSTQTLQP